MTAIPAPLRKLVRRRARNRCEYCSLSQRGQEAVFHMDHVTPGSEGGLTAAENLALACVSCSLRKGARTQGIDPLSGQAAILFNPRRQHWDEHFLWNGVKVEGLTATGRATVLTLKMNHARMIRIRREEKANGRHPPNSW